MISVHRGLWSAAPENSLAGIAAARDFGIVEIDTQIAADGVPVLMHDTPLRRMTGQGGTVAATPSANLLRLPLRTGDGGDGAALTDQKIPTLAQALALPGAAPFFDIDVKHPAEIGLVAAEIARLGRQACGSLKIDTATPEDIARLTQLQDQHGLMVMAKVILPTVGLAHIADLVAAGVAAAELWFDDLAQLRAACDIAGDRMAISTFTLDPVHCCGLSDSRARTDPAGVWGRLIEAGVTILMTDRAPALAAYQDHRG